MTEITLKVVSEGNRTSHSQIELRLYKKHAALLLLSIKLHYK